MEYPRLTASYDAAHNRWSSQGLPPNAGSKLALSRSDLHDVAACHFIETARFTSELKNAFFGQSDVSAPRSRERYISAIATICSHMKNIGVPAIITAEFVALATALNDLDDGSVHPMLQKRKPNGSPRLLGENWQAKAYVAAAVALLDADGIQKRAACERIAKEFPQLGTPPLCKKPLNTRELAGAIGEWHKIFAGGDVPEAAAQSIFNERGRFFAILANLNPAADRASIARSALGFAVYHATRLSAQTAEGEK